MRASIILLLGLAVAACDSEVNQSVGSEAIRGQLLQQSDAFTNPSEYLPVSGKSVTIDFSNSSADTTNYLFRTTTDGEGYFAFTSLIEGKTYTLRYQDTIQGVRYFAKHTVMADNDTVMLRARLATTGQTGLLLKAEDASQQPLSGVTHCLFRSEEVARTAKGGCSGRNFVATSDANGLSQVFNLPGGDYFVNSSVTHNAIPLYSSDKVTITKDRLNPITITLTATKGVRFRVEDRLGSTRAGVKICLFPGTDSFAGSCTNSLVELTTSLDGTVEKYGLDPGRYIAYSQVEASNGRLTSVDTFDVGEITTMVPITLTPTNGIRFTTLDALGSRLPNTTICLFTSRLLYEQNDCAKSNYTLTTNAEGVISKFDLPKDSYYIYSHYAVNDSTKWVARDSVDLGNQVEPISLRLSPE